MNLTTTFKSSIILLFISMFLLDTTHCVTSEECFCGITNSNGQQDSIDIYDYNLASYQSAKIVNFLDQSVSKFNSLHLQSTKAKLPFKLSGDSTSSQTPMDIRLSFLKSLHFETNKDQNQVLSTSFMMGGIVNFDVSFEIIHDYSKENTSFKFILNQNEYKRGTSITKSINKYHIESNILFTSYSNLELEVCKFMYSGLNYFSNSIFKNNMGADLISKSKKKKRGRKNDDDSTCSHEIIFKKRYDDAYLTEVISEEISSSQRNTYRKHRIVLTPNEKKMYFKISVDSNNAKNPSSYIKKRLNNLVDDRSSTSREIEQSEVSDEQQKENVYELRNRNVPKKVIIPTKDSDDEVKKINDQELENQVDQIHNTLKTKIKEMMTNPNKKAEDVQSVDDQKKQILDKVKNKISQMMSNHNKKQENEISNPNVISLRNRDVPRNISQDNKDETSIDSEDLSNEFVDTEVKESKHEKQKKKVIVLLETVECSKCMNDVDSIQFLKMLGVKSKLI